MITLYLKNAVFKFWFRNIPKKKALPYVIGFLLVFGVLHLIFTDRIYKHICDAFTILRLLLDLNKNKGEII